MEMDNKTMIRNTILNMDLGEDVTCLLKDVLDEYNYIDYSEKTLAELKEKLADVYEMDRLHELNALCYIAQELLTDVETFIRFCNKVIDGEICVYGIYTLNGVGVQIFREYYDYEPDDIDLIERELEIIADITLNNYSDILAFDERYGLVRLTRRKI